MPAPRFSALSAAVLAAVLAAALCAGIASAQDATTDDTDNAANAQALEAAHQAALRRVALESKVRRELMLQRVCNAPASASCSDTNNANCAAEIAQSCQSFKEEAATCLQDAANYCATSTDANCEDVRSAQCPSYDKQSLADLFAKYPALELDQKTRLARYAAQLDARLGNWFTRLFGSSGS